MSKNEENTMEQKAFAKPSLLKTLIGLGLLMGALALMIYALKNIKTENEDFVQLQQSLVTVTDTTQVDPANDGHMVYLATQLRQVGAAYDPLFGVGGEAYTCIVRNVSYYQWTEQSRKRKKTFTESHEAPDGYQTREEKTVTEYYYEKAWSGQLHNSDAFHEPGGHRNVQRLVIDSERFMADGVMAVPYWLGGEMLSNMTSQGGSLVSLKGMSLQQARRPLMEDGMPMGVHLLGDSVIYYGADPADPQLGDVKVSFMGFAMEKNKKYVLALAQGDSLLPYSMKTGNKVYYKISDEAFDAAERMANNVSGNNYFTIFIALVVWLLTVWAVKMLEGRVLNPMCRLPLIGPLLAKTNKKTASWLAGTLLAAVIICLSYLGR